MQDKTQNLDCLEQNLIAAQLKLIETKQNKLQLSSRALNAISPLATLDRGYAIITNKNNIVIQKSNAVKIGEKINAKLAAGKLQCTVEQIYEND